MDEAIEIANGRAPEQTFAAPAPHDEAAARLQSAIDHSQRALLALQRPEGYWQAALEANAEMNAEFIIFNHFMDTVDLELEARLKKHLLDTQSADGSWALYRGGEGYLSTTIESYFALKLTGMTAGDEPLAAARREFEEETGKRVEGDVVSLGDVVQPGRKVVAAFALEGEFDPKELRSNLFELEWPPRSGRKKSFPEVDRAGWFSPDEALRRILSGQRDLITRLVAALGETS